MKILLISNMYPSQNHPTYGIFVKNFENQLKKEGFEFDKAVIYGRGKNKLEKIVKYSKFFVEVFQKVTKGNYDLIYVHYVNHSLLPLLFVKPIIKKPLVINAHGSDIFVNNKIASYIQKLVTSIINAADLIVVPSKYFKDIVSIKFGINKNKIFVSPSGGVNTNLFKPYNKTTDIFTIGYVSRIDKGKGWNILLDAVNSLKNKYTFKVLIVGGGAEEDLLLKKIKKLNLENIVEFVGSKPHNELVKYFNKMDIFVFPTIRIAESLGLVGLEAMACGLPVIGSNIGGLREYIKSGINGELFEPGNVNELVEKLEYFIKMDKEKMYKYRQAALNTAKEYDAKLVAKKLSDKLRKLISTQEL